MKQNIIDVDDTDSIGGGGGSSSTPNIEKKKTSKIRKWLIRNFVLDTWAKLFGKSFKFVRASRVLFPLFAIVGIIITTDPAWPLLQWWDYVLLVILALAVDFGFSFFPFSYFNKYPVKFEELDDEQKHAMYNARLSGQLTNVEYRKVVDEDGTVHMESMDKLTEEEWKDLDRLTQKLEEKYKGNFAGLWNLAPTFFAIILVIIWAIWIFPHFNPNWTPDPNMKHWF